MTTLHIEVPEATANPAAHQDTVKHKTPMEPMP
jgi:hypothetical protein